MTFKHIILKNSLSNQLASNDSGIALDIIKWKLRTRITRNAYRSLLPCDFDTPFNPFQKIMWAPKLFQQLDSIKHNSLDLFRQQPLPDTSSSIPGSRFVFNGIFTLLANVLLLGGTLWQAALHSVAESPGVGLEMSGTAWSQRAAMATWKHQGEADWFVEQTKFDTCPRTSFY